MAPSKSLAETEPDTERSSSTCEQCGEALRDGARFCRHCGTIQSEHAPTPAEEPSPEVDATEGERCVACGVTLADPASRFCRHCGAHRAQDPARAIEPVDDAPRSDEVRAGRCRSCDAELVADRRFCQVCGTATVDGRTADRAGVDRDPAWRRVVRGLTLVLEGSFTLVGAAVAAAAVVTLLSLLDPDWETGEALRVGLLGAASLAALVGFGLLVWGDATNLWIPRTARARVHALVVLSLSGASALLGVLALLQIAWTGFEPEAISGAGALSIAALLVLLARWVAFTTLLRRLAFALRHYRIAQGAIGFIVFTGAGLAIVGLIHLLFRTASSAAQTFAELLGLAFVVLVALWALTLARRGRDLVRARLP